MRVTEELAAWQDVARALAHELKNPLTAMKLAVARTARAIDRVDLEPPVENAFRESMQLFDQEMDVLIRMTKSFSEFAKLPRPTLESVELAGLLEEVAALYREASPVAIELDVGEPPYVVRGDPGQLRRALGNLVKNATEASREPATVPIRISTRSGPDQRVRVIVSPTAGGASRSRYPARQLTRSLGSTKPDGSGLGLPISYKIIHDHRGEPGPRAGSRWRLPAPIVLPCQSWKTEESTSS